MRPLMRKLPFTPTMPILETAGLVLLIVASQLR